MRNDCPSVVGPAKIFAGFFLPWAFRRVRVVRAQSPEGDSKHVLQWRLPTQRVTCPRDFIPFTSGAALPQLVRAYVSAAAISASRSLQSNGGYANANDATFAYYRRARSGLEHGCLSFGEPGEYAVDALYGGIVPGPGIALENLGAKWHCGRRCRELLRIEKL